MRKIFNYTILLLFFCVTTSLNATCQLVDLGVSASDRSEAVAVNDKGQIVGSYWLQGHKFFFLWEEQKDITLLDLPQTAEIKVLNNQGQIAGEYHTEDSTHGFFLDLAKHLSSQEPLYDLGTLGGNTTTVADMNDHGHIVGWSSTDSISVIDSQPQKHAYMWAEGQMIDLGTLVGDLGIAGDDSAAVGINDNGLIIGRSNLTLIHKGKLLKSGERPVIWKNCQIELFNKRVDGKEIESLCSINDSLIACKYGRGYHIFSPQFDKMMYHVVFSDPPKMVKGVFLSSNTVFINGSHFQPHDLFKKTASLPWSKLVHLNDLNEKRWLVGVASNIYGEEHAILLKVTP